MESIALSCWSTQRSETPRLARSPPASRWTQLSRARQRRGDQRGVSVVPCLVGVDLEAVRVEKTAAALDVLEMQVFLGCTKG